jgi:hypothetical protein
MGLTEQQLGRLAAFVAELGENPSNEVLREAGAALKDQAPQMYTAIFHGGFHEAESRWKERAQRAEAELTRRSTGSLPLEQQMADLRSTMERERRGRITAEIFSVLTAKGIDADWAENQLERDWRTGALAMDAAGALEASGIRPGEGQTVAAAYVETLAKRCPPKWIASRGDTGSHTGQDRGAGGAQSLVAQHIAAMDATWAEGQKKNPLFGPAAGPWTGAVEAEGMRRDLEQQRLFGRVTELEQRPQPTKGAKQ